MIKNNVAMEAYCIADYIHRPFKKGKKAERFLGSREFNSVMVVYCNNGERFFLFKNAGDGLYKHLGYKILRPIISKKDYASYSYKEDLVADCVIIDKDKFIQNEKEVSEYLQKHESNIENSSEIPIENIIEGKDIKISSRTSITPMRKLFRELGLMEEKRGPKKGENSFKKDRDDFIVRAYQESSKKKPFPYQSIKSDWKKEAFKRGVSLELSKSTIRRAIKNSIKK